ncbi:BlaI/MecI/CopY family transcriptional regulator [uncultured Gimesia sp.]|uniref:BlaI/MecI/CopY family transcriptional regulator n=1 Tax=uncultured Gimesia sp. TaxID=1678688 RepID=UPI0030DABD09|tara:strand:- start:73223 stop:73606 length:384 start_codon:yes stop_codon:yes gene_type:complete
MGITELSAAEQEVMEVVWDRGEVTAREAREALSRDVARNTVRTLLERMEEKGWVTHREVGRAFVYRAARPREESIGRKVREMVDTVCGGSTETLVAALLDYRGLRPGELERIRKMLKEAKGGRLKNG